MAKILIVDNQLEWLNFARQTLLDEGHEVIEANSLRSFETILVHNHYDLILVNADFMFGDFQKPMHRLFTEHKDRPIIVVSVPSSSYRIVQETRTAFKLGAKDCVDKPFSKERLLRLVQQLLTEFSDAQLDPQGAIT